MNIFGLGTQLASGISQLFKSADAPARPDPVDRALASGSDAAYKVDLQSSTEAHAKITEAENEGS